MCISHRQFEVLTIVARRSIHFDSYQSCHRIFLNHCSKRRNAVFFFFIISNSRGIKNRFILEKSVRALRVIVATGRRLEWKRRRSVVSRGRRWNDASKKNRYERRSIFLSGLCCASTWPGFLSDNGEIYRGYNRNEYDSGFEKFVAAVFDRSKILFIVYYLESWVF